MAPDGSPAPAAAATAAAAPGLIQSVTDPEYRLAVEVLYHGARQAFFVAAHRWAMCATIVFGASATAIFAPALFGILAAATAAADIAFDFTGRAQVHGDIRRRYLSLAARLAQGDEQASRNFAAEWMAISAEEPPTYRWAEMIAHENACQALGRPAPACTLTTRQRMFAHVRRG